MDKREAKRRACWMAGVALDSFISGGWPFNTQESHEAGLVNDEEEPTPDGLRLQTALQEIANELIHRGRDAFVGEDDETV